MYSVMCTQALPDQGEAASVYSRSASCLSLQSRREVSTEAVLLRQNFVESAALRRRLRGQLLREAPFDIPGRSLHFGTRIGTRYVGGIRLTQGTDGLVDRYPNDVIQKWTKGKSTLPFGKNVAVLSRASISPCLLLNGLRHMQLAGKGLFGLLVNIGLTAALHSAGVDRVTAIVKDDFGGIQRILLRSGFEEVPTDGVLYSESIPGQRVRVRQFQFLPDGKRSLLDENLRFYGDRFHRSGFVLGGELSSSQRISRHIESTTF